MIASSEYHTFRSTMHCIYIVDSLPIQSVGYHMDRSATWRFSNENGAFEVFIRFGEDEVAELLFEVVFWARLVDDVLQSRIKIDG